MVLESFDQPPVIGITAFRQTEQTYFSVSGAYVNAVRLAGGLPILLPPGELNHRHILQLVDGLILSGGGDLDPATYNGSSHPTIYKVDPERDAFELELAWQILETNTPVLGICRGLQVLVVASGGNLVPHVPDQFGNTITHRVDQFCSSQHPVQIAAGSQLAKIIGATEVTIASWHHQAVQTVPSGWRVTAHAADGVIEALEHQHHPWAIALQWHPELSPYDLWQQRIFQGFVAAARNCKQAVTL